MNLEPIIEPIQRDEVEAFFRVNKESWLDTYVNDNLGIAREMLSEFCDKLASVERVAKFKEAIDSGKVESVYVLKLDGKVIGCLQFFIKDSIGNIRILYIDPKYIGKGYGKRLITFALEQLKLQNVEKVELEVVEYNNRAIDFYQRAGFEHTGKPGKDFELTENLVMKTIIMEMKFNKII